MARIREATPADVGAMIPIWIEFIDLHRDFEPVYQRTKDGHERFGAFVKERIAMPNWCVAVAEIETQIVGHIMGSVAERPPVFEKVRFGYIQDIAVGEAYRRGGIGTALFNYLCEWFQKQQLSDMELDRVAANPLSQGFWRKMGFTDLMVRMRRSL